METCTPNNAETKKQDKNYNATVDGYGYSVYIMHSLLLRKASARKFLLLLAKRKRKP